MALPAGLPQYTLGWGILDWCSAYLAHPSNEPGDYGKPWVFTDEQAMFTLWFYAVDRYGKMLYRRGVLERPKGWGKSPFAAALAAAEMLGPVVFDGFDSENKVVGRRRGNAIVQIAAISEAQVENSYGPLLTMLGNGRAFDEYNLDVGMTRILGPYGARIEKVTASPASREGRQSTFAIGDETHLWTPAQHGHDLSAVIRRNLAKMRGKFLETTNAHVPGEQSVAEESHNYALQIEDGTIEEAGLLFDSKRSTCENLYDKDQFLAAAKIAYGDAYWIDLGHLWREVNDPANRESEMRRFYLNELHRGDTQWIKPADWEKCTDLTMKPLKKSDKFALGFWGKRRNGAAALVACRLKDSAIFLLKLWEMPAEEPQGWEVPFREVDAVARRWMNKLSKNCWIYANPWGYQDVVGQWAVDYEDMVEGFWSSQKLKVAKAVDAFEEAVMTKVLKHDGDKALARHVDNCHVEELTEGHILRMEAEHSKSYICAAQAAVLAYEAAQFSISEGALKESDNYIYGF